MELAHTVMEAEKSQDLPSFSQQETQKSQWNKFQSNSKFKGKRRLKS